MIASYYVPRWEEFIRRLDESLAGNKPFDSKSYLQWRTDFEGKWVDSTTGNFSAEPRGDAAGVAKEMLNKYRGH